MKRTVHKVELPIDFAQRLLDNQIQFKLSQSPSKQVINNLIQLYTYGVEYYEAIKSYKYLYFQAKMKELFNAGNTLQIINAKTQIQKVADQSPIHKKMKSSKQQEKIEAFKIKQNQQKMLNQIFHRTSYTLTSSQTQSILKESDSKEVKVQKVITQQLETQERSLEEKIKLRKVKNQFAKSMSSIELFETPTRDSLFQLDSIDKKAQIYPNKNQIKQPLKVNFESFINQKQESQEGDQQSDRMRQKQAFKSMEVSSKKLAKELGQQAIYKNQKEEMSEEQISALIESIDFGNS